MPSAYAETGQILVCAEYDSSTPKNFEQDFLEDLKSPNLSGLEVTSSEQFREFALKRPVLNGKPIFVLSIKTSRQVELLRISRKSFCAAMEGEVISRKIVTPEMFGLPPQHSISEERLKTHRYILPTLTGLIISGSRWTKELVKSHLEQTKQIIGECGVEILELSVKDAPNQEHHLDDFFDASEESYKNDEVSDFERMIGGIVDSAVGSIRPVLIYAKNYYYSPRPSKDFVSPKGQAKSFIPGRNVKLESPAGNTSIIDDSFITPKDNDLVDAHELVHLLLNDTSHSLEPGNLMSGHEPMNFLTKSQCAIIRGSPMVHEVSR